MHEPMAQKASEAIITILEQKVNHLGRLSSKMNPQTWDKALVLDLIFRAHFGTVAYYESMDRGITLQLRQAKEDIRCRSSGGNPLTQLEAITGTKCKACKYSQKEIADYELFLGTNLQEHKPARNAWRRPLRTTSCYGKCASHVPWATSSWLNKGA